MKVRILLYCILGSLPLLIGALGTGHWPWWLISGMVLAAAFVPIARFGPKSLFGQLAVICAALMVITVLCTWSEAVLFVKTPEIQQHRIQMLAGSLFMYLIVAVVLAILGRVLRIANELPMAIEHRKVPGTVLVVLAGGIAYALYYFVFGAITYQYFTKGYYPTAVAEVQQLGLWFWAIQIGRGIAMTLGVLPILYTLRMPRWQTALVTGMVIWVAGGLAPLLVPNQFMGSTQRVIHIVEILTQNFSLGITVGLLFRAKTKVQAARIAAAV